MTQLDKIREDLQALPAGSAIRYDAETMIAATYDGLRELKVQYGGDHCGNAIKLALALADAYGVTYEVLGHQIQFYRLWP